MTQSPFFIVGEARSGTTLLRIMIDGHPSLAIPQESHFIPYLYGMRHSYGDLSVVGNRERMVEAVVRTTDIGWGVNSWAPGLKDNTRQVAEGAEPTFAGVIDAVFRYATKEKQLLRWGDKTPRYVLHLPLLLDLFPEARFIHLVRDGRDVAASLLPLPFGANSPLEAGRGWVQCVKAGEAFVAAHPNQAMTVRYEDLVAKPMEELTRLCAFLGVEYHENMMQYRDKSIIKKAARETNPSRHQLLAHAPTTSRVGSYKTRLTDKQRVLFESEAGEMLVKLGYPPPEALYKVSAKEAFVDKVQDKILSFYRTPKKKRAKLAWWRAEQKLAGLRRRFGK